MRNIIILGSGRSGTSLVSGTLGKAGYFMGDCLLRPSEINPKGFFEDSEVNGINEEVLEIFAKKRPPILGRWFFRDRPLKWQRWLASIPLSTKFIPTKVSHEIIERIRKVTAKAPYCYKDPRFCYTLPIWRPFLNNTVFICVFREPAIIAESILKMCKEGRLHPLSINFNQAINIITLMYCHIIEIHCKKGEWLFIHYNQVMTERGLSKLEKFTGAIADRSFADSSLHRSFSHKPIPKETMQVYQKLCALAEHEEAFEIPNFSKV